MTAMNIDTVERQTAYVKQQKQRGKGLGLVFADAFLRGMRDIGYKSPAWSFAEGIDNSFQAGANTVSILFGFDAGNRSKGKPDLIAIADNGNGMIPEMISYAVRWGGTDREGDRTGFGRYGYGLPSSIVSLAKKYTVYSKTRKSEWHAVNVDLDALAAAAGNVEQTEKLLAPKLAELPSWVIETDDKLNLSKLPSGTVIVLEDLDRLRKMSGWIMMSTLVAKLLQQFGVIYRHWIPERRIFVDGNQVQAVDPLFLMEHGRFYDETPVRAIAVETRTFEVEVDEKTKGKITIRASLLPPNFQLVDPAQYGRKGAKNNKRWEIMKDYNGLLICRERRQIDTVVPKWTKYQVYDANVKIEIDFDPELDEFFGITTSKQQIVIDDEMWEKLRHSGKNGGAIEDLVADLRRERDKLEKELKANAENTETQDQPRASVAAMEESEKFKDSQPEPTPEQAQEAQRNLEHAATERANVTGEPKQEALEKLTHETATHKWELQFLSIEEGPFYRPKRLGQQKRLIINTDHPFYTKLYNAAGPDVRAALEVLLFVLAERELESQGDAETFYKSERNKWSERLRNALDTLLTDEALVNKASAVAAFMHASVGYEA